MEAVEKRQKGKGVQMAGPTKDAKTQDVVERSKGSIKKAATDVAGGGPPVDLMKAIVKGETLLGQNLKTALLLDVPASTAFVALLLIWRYFGYGRIRVLSSRRTLKDQQRLYGQGRTRAECMSAKVPMEYAHPKLGQVTWCRPEDSMHLRGRAMDLMLDEYAVDHQGRLYAIARELGFRLGVDWEKKDCRHFEWRGGYDGGCGGT